MEALPHSIEECISEALREVEPLMRAAFEEVGGVAPADSALDQAGLKDGAEMVVDYLTHGERGLALEHLIYMVRETDLPISRRTYGCMERAANQMGLGERFGQRVRRPGDDG
jgi:hypothetical protein